VTRTTQPSGNGSGSSGNSMLQVAAAAALITFQCCGRI